MSCGHRGGVEVWLTSLPTSALGGVGGKRHAPAALPHDKGPRYPLYRKAGLAKGPVCKTVGKNLLRPPELEPKTVQSIASLHTAYGVQTTLSINCVDRTIY